MLVGNAEGNPLLVGTFDPTQAAYNVLPNGIYSASVNAQLSPPELSGPAVAPYAMSFVFQDLETSIIPLYTLHTFDSLRNQPTIVKSGQCVRNNEYSNQTFTDPHMRLGNVTFGQCTSGLLSCLGPTISGQYMNVQGLSSSSVHVGQVMTEDCATAYKNNDPAASL